MITHAKSNHSLSPSAADTVIAILKKDGWVRQVEADMKIYLSYSINRKPIACLLQDIMTDVRANASLHFYSMNISLYASVVSIVELITHSNAYCEPWVAAATAAALGSHLCLHCVHNDKYVCQFICRFNLNMFMWCTSELDHAKGWKRHNLESFSECYSL